MVFAKGYAWEMVRLWLSLILNARRPSSSLNMLCPSTMRLLSQAVGGIMQSPLRHGKFVVCFRTSPYPLGFLSVNLCFTVSGFHSTHSSRSHPAVPADSCYHRSLLSTLRIRTRHKLGFRPCSDRSRLPCQRRSGRRRGLSL